MKFETKVLLSFIATIVAGFSIVNFLSVVYLKLLIDEQLNKEIKYIHKLYKFNPNIKLPEYILISREPNTPNGYEIIDYTGEYFIFVKKDHIQGKLKNFSLFLFLWESVFIVALVLTFYRVIWVYLKKEQNMKDMFRILLLAFTHRLGNFLSIQRINLELLEETKAVDRLKSNLKKLNTEYEKLLTSIVKIQEGSGLGKERINLRERISDIVDREVRGRDIRLILDLRDAYVSLNPLYTDILLSSLVENSFKYAQTYVHIKLCLSKKGKPVLIIRNDFRSVQEGGTGIGLQIVRFVSQKLGVSLRYKIKKTFTVILEF